MARRGFSFFFRSISLVGFVCRRGRQRPCMRQKAWLFLALRVRAGAPPQHGNPLAGSHTPTWQESWHLGGRITMPMERRVVSACCWLSRKQSPATMSDCCVASLSCQGANDSMLATRAIPTNGQLSVYNFDVCVCVYPHVCVIPIPVRVRERRAQRWGGGRAPIRSLCGLNRLVRLNRHAASNDSFAQALCVYAVAAQSN